MPAIAIGTHLGSAAKGTTGAAALVAGETQAFSVDFLGMSALVRDTGTPANNFDGNPNSLLTYTAPSSKWVRLSSGLYALGSTLRTEYATSGAPLGVWCEESRTSLAIRGRELGNATYWTATNISTSAVQGVDGVLGSATRISATAGNGTVIGTANTSASAARRLAPFVRRVAGTGDLEWTLDNGATWTAFSGITSSWQRLGVGQTVANPQVGFRVVSSGNSFDIDFANGETGSFDTSPMHTDGAAAVITRAADNVSIATSAFPASATDVTIFIEVSHVRSTGNPSLLAMSNGTINERVQLYRNSGAGWLVVTDGGASQASVSSGITIDETSTFKLAGAASANSFRCAVNGTLSSSDTAGTMPTYTGLYFGNAAATGVSGAWYVRRAFCLPRRMSDADMQTRTAV